MTDPAAPIAHLDPLPVVLAFDVFGTVVDWYGSIEREVAALGLGIDAGAFALAWRAGYQPAMARVRSGELGWTKIDALHRMILDDVVERFGVADRLDQAARRSLNLAWHRLDPWPDAVEGLGRLRRRFTLCTLSNGNLALLADMAKRAALPWDLILSAEVFRHYKPDPEAYLGVCEVFDVEPARMMLVAAHHDDLAAARACGCRTAHVARPLEFGPKVAADVAPRPGNDLHARDFRDLARQLGC
ncbi:MAG: haloacid dehalogenase type II [Burkholderiaceae bacterium]|nr:haloacid dehalogenase type II [Burkholderiaceae bacterium]